MLSWAAQNGPSILVFPVQLSNPRTPGTLGLPSLSLQAEPFLLGELCCTGFKLPVSVHSDHRLFQLLPADMLDAPLKDSVKLYSVEFSARRIVMYAHIPLIVISPEKH